VLARGIGDGILARDIPPAAVRAVLDQFIAGVAA